MWRGRGRAKVIEGRYHGASIHYSIGFGCGASSGPMAKTTAPGPLANLRVRAVTPEPQCLTVNLQTLIASG